MLYCFYGLIIFLALQMDDLDLKKSYTIHSTKTKENCQQVSQAWGVNQVLMDDANKSAKISIDFRYFLFCLSTLQVTVSIFNV